MARVMDTNSDAPKAYRAVILNPAGDVVATYGPYDNRGAAARMVTRETRARWAGLSPRTGRVEVTPLSWADESAPAPQKPAQPLHAFTSWPKTPRLLRDCTVTEKLDGTNAAIAVRPCTAEQLGDDESAAYAFNGDGFFAVYAQSRNRIITPGSDNAGFAGWVHSNADLLAARLGPGLHYGEWWGSKVGRKYELNHKRFSLFNTDKHADLDEVIGGVPVGPVPVLYRGPFSTAEVSTVLGELACKGSVAAPGFMNPEGVCVFHHASRQVFKVTLDKQDAGKWEFEALESLAL